MKFQVKFKTPNATERALEELECQCNGPNSCPDCETKEWEAIDAKKLVETFVQYDEYVTIEFDTEAKTATVVPIA